MNKKLTNDMRHNLSCFAYLGQLKPFITADILKLLPQLRILAELPKAYNKNTAYGNVYNTIMTYLEDEIEAIYSLHSSVLKPLLYAIYHNDNHILEKDSWLKAINADITPGQCNKNELIEAHLKDTQEPINRFNPEQAESLSNRLKNMLSSSYKPQNHTNIPSLKHNSYQIRPQAQEYRFPTQAQRHQGTVRMSPLFKLWLKISAEKAPPEQRFAHVYFNFLGLDRFSPDFVGLNERRFSLALHELEQDKTFKIAVVTLPAARMYMSCSHYLVTQDKLNYDSEFESMLVLAEKEYHPSGVVDIKISSDVRNFVDLNHSKLHGLLEKSFTFMGIHPGNTLSTAQRQAVWVHFTKFELANHIMEAINPQSYNFSCKEAIDRGPISASYYHLIKSFLSNSPMTQNEFERSIDIASANVRGRGVNYHNTILWNTVNIFVNAHHQQLIQDPGKSWLIAWRDYNCPESQISELLPLRIKQFKAQINALPRRSKTLKQCGNQLAVALEEYNQEQINENSTLFEVVARSSQLIFNSKSRTCQKNYQQLMQKIETHHSPISLLNKLMNALQTALIQFLSLLPFSLFNNHAKLKQNHIGKLQERMQALKSTSLTS